jgi:hypothetical protein
MKKWKGFLAGLLALTVMGVGYPKVACCEEARLSAKNDTKSITRYEPKFKSEPEKDIPLVQDEKNGKKGKWIMYGLGAVALAVGVGLAAGGGGGGGGGDPSASSGSGSVAVSW